ncbi:hypothetical protein K501DRAFT_64643 [Backusella circina FSU 941]|nr:hypothetical protein K501DRAFT_64643 [Backusella circina FSU 941]
MSGESPPNIPGRFTGLSNNNNKKYPGTPKSPLLNNNAAGGNRNSQARARLLSSKISAPRPINLPSLRREHAVGTDIPAAGSPAAPNHGWGSSSSPFTSPKQCEITPEEVASETIKKMDDQHSESMSNGPTSTLNEEPPHSPPRAWAAPTVQHIVKPPSDEFPTAAEAVAGKSNEKEEELDEDDKDYLKFIMSDPNHKSWDEMVAEDFEDDITETMEFDELNEQTENNGAVSPSERFTEDYDRSYPPQLKQTRDNDNYKHFRRNDDNHRYNSNYDNNNNTSRRYSSSESGGGGGGNERRHSNDRWNNNSSNHRRDSVEQKNTPGGGTWQRRPSYDRKTPYQPTLLQRNRRMSEQSARSDHSREDHVPPSSEQNPLQIIPEPDVVEGNPAEITAVQREVMMTAAERAKKRRDEEEAEYEAARERARQKAAALALMEETKIKPEETPSVEIKSTNNNIGREVKEILKPDSPPSSSLQDDEKNPAPSSAIGDVSKPWNLVAAKKEQSGKTVPKSSTPEEEPKLSESNTTNTSSKASTALTEDEQIWEKHVSEIRRNSAELKSSKVVTANDWTQYAGRLQEKSFNKNTVQKNDESAVQVEVIDFQKNKAWGEIPSNITRGRGRRNEGWTMADEENHSRSHGRGRGRKTSGSSHSSSTQQRRRLSDTTDSWRQHPVKEPIVLEILKHSPSCSTSPPAPVATIPEKVEEPECPKQKCASKISNLLHESSSPIFPLSIERLVGKKPRNISFMIDTEESDEEITMTRATPSCQQSDTIQDEQIESNEEEKDLKSSDNTTTPSNSGESSPSTSPAVSHGQKMEGSEMKRMAGNPNFPVLIYQFPSSTVQNNDASSSPPLHGYVTRPDGSQQRPVGVYLSAPPQYVSGNQYMVPYPQAGTGNVQPIYFPTVSWQQQQIQQRYNVHPNRSYYDRNSNNNRPSYRSNRHSDEDWKYPSTTTTDSYSGRGSYRKRGQYSTSRGRGHSASLFYKKNIEFEHSSSTAVQDP